MEEENNKNKKTGRKILLAVILFFFIIFIIIFMIGVGINNTFFNLNFHEKLVTDAGIFENIDYSFIISDLEENMSDSERAYEGAKEKDMGEEEMEKVILIAMSEAFPPEWFEDTYLDVVEEIITVIKRDKEEIDLVIDLKDNKEILVNEITEEIELLIDDKEIEGAEIDKPSIKGTNEFSENDEKFEANITDEEFLEFEDNEIIGDGFVEEEMEDFPTEIELKEVLPERMLNFIGIVRKVFFILSSIFLIIFIVLFFIFGKFEGSFKWVGVGIFLPGIILYLISFLIFLTISKSIIEIGKNMPLSLEKLVTVWGLVMSSFRTIFLIFLILGVLLFATGFIIEKFRD